MLMNKNGIFILPLYNNIELKNLYDLHEQCNLTFVVENGKITGVEKNIINKN